ncbi:glycosyltransferase [Caldalkalibacillus salinus]|uniref:glycosyltransferase n=1 Tax=Caldalkalibacillus salinus TaxID=2803787 RepID=UPI0019224675
MRVLIVPSWYPTNKSPNSGIFFKEQALALQEFGLDITVAYPEIWNLKNIKNHRIKSGFSKDYESGVLTYRIRGYNFFPKVKHAPRVIFYKRLKKILKYYIEENGKPDILHAHSILWGGWAAAQISKEYNIPLVITEHFSGYGRGLIKDYQISFVKDTLNTAKRLIVVGPGLKREMQRYVSKDKIIIIPNIVDVAKFNTLTTPIYKSNKFRFFSLAFLNYNKGIDILIKSFAKSFKGNESVELVIGGDGDAMDDLIKLVRDEGLNNQVHFLGPLSREQVVLEMHQCDVFVLPSRYETFGVVYIEALACGKPIIATKCGGPEMIVNNNNGLLVNVDDVEDLSRAMDEIIINHSTYNSTFIKNECTINYGKEHISEKIYNEVYKDL